MQLDDVLSIYEKLYKKYFTQNQISEFQNWYMTDFLQYFIESWIQNQTCRNRWWMA